MRQHHGKLKTDRQTNTGYREDRETKTERGERIDREREGRETGIEREREINTEKKREIYRKGEKQIERNIDNEHKIHT